MTVSGGTNAWAFLVPFLLSIAVASVAFFVLRALRKKKHPDEETEKETNRRRREREKLEKQTMEKVTNTLSKKKDSGEEKAPDGLRSGKHNKKKKK